jgi:uncharacterized protein YbjT (DUF2867 family)
MTDPLDGLSPKHRAFVVEYMKDRNATQAALRAGYAEGSAHVTGHRLLKHDKVRTAVRDLSSREEKAALEGMQGSKQLLVDLLWKYAQLEANPSAAIQAIKALAPSYDLVVDSSVVKNDNTNRNAPSDASSSELEAELKRRGLDPKVLRPSARTNVVKMPRKAG